MHFPKVLLKLGLLTLASPAMSNPMVVTPNKNFESKPTSSVSCAVEMFSSLLSLADPRALHRALHASHPKYTDGAYESDQHAIEAVHNEAPHLATAILELARRQEGSGDGATPNSTSPVSEPQRTSVAVVTASPTNVIVVQTSTQQPPSTEQPPSTSEPARTVTSAVVTPTSAPVSSAAPPPSSPSSSPRPMSTLVAQQTTSSVVVVVSTQPTSAPATSSVQVTSASPSPTTAPQSAAQSSSSSDDDDESASTSVYLTTYTPPGGGAPSTLTAITVIGVPGKGGSANAAQTSATPKPSGTLRDAAGMLSPDAYLAGVVGMLAAYVMGIVA